MAEDSKNKISDGIVIALISIAIGWLIGFVPPDSWRSVFFGAQWCGYSPGQIYKKVADQEGLKRVEPRAQGQYAPLVLVDSGPGTYDFVPRARSSNIYIGRSEVLRETFENASNVKSGTVGECTHYKKNEGFSKFIPTDEVPCAYRNVEELKTVELPEGLALAISSTRESSAVVRKHGLFGKASIPGDLTCQVNFTY